MYKIFFKDGEILENDWNYKSSINGILSLGKLKWFEIEDEVEHGYLWWKKKYKKTSRYPHNVITDEINMDSIKRIEIKKEKENGA